MKHRFATMIIAATLLAAAPVAATAQEREDPRSLASEGVQQLIRAMELMLLAIPQYEAPEINENGDIIIRRKNPERPRHKDNPTPGKKDKAI